MFTRRFWADLLERASKAAAWSLLGALTAVADGTLTGVDWPQAFNVAGRVFLIAALANFLGTKVAGIGAPDSASFLPARLDPPRSDPGYTRAELLVAVVLGGSVLILLTVLLAGR